VREFGGRPSAVGDYHSALQRAGGRANAQLRQSPALSASLALWLSLETSGPQAQNGQMNE